MTDSRTGTLVMLVFVQLSVPGLSAIPAGVDEEGIVVFSSPDNHFSPVHTAVCESRGSGGAAVAVQVSSMHVARSDIFGSR